ncbi:hypothetical protein PENCOP_c001G03275 [Penicillium coprophilum]|uniref:NADP-dependent oxidoreductase domain-containing protein n=1 Tax=Penicillium coprophilum TaxID=36646 RepID=A0A1V6V666_9EURO|nr:hypothetical protein PENCOP_c001G03275 [Penicillium coprophilum]
MATPGTQYMMQAGLAAGMSATQGMHSPRPNPVDPHLSDPISMLPSDLKPDSKSRITLRSVNAWAKLKSVGLTFVDTAQSYGDGESERICGTPFRACDSFVVQTKWLSTPDMTNTCIQAGGPKSKLEDSLSRLQLDYVDIYLVHGPIHPIKISTVAKGMADCMIKMADELAKHGVPLSVCQCEYSIVRRLHEVSGLTRECRKRSICFQGFASLAQGRLSGKYSRSNEPQRRRRFSSHPMHVLEPTANVLKTIAEERSVPVPAVGLNYSIMKGVLPLVGVRDARQAEQDMQALGWRLTEDEIKQIQGVSLQGSRFSLMQHG